MRLLVAAGFALALAGCGKDGGTGKAQGPVVLTINEKSYTTADLEREINQELRRTPELQPALASKDGQKQLLDRLVRRELLLQEAERRKMGERSEVADQLAAFRRDMLIRALLQEEIGAKVTVEEKEVQEYFSSHPDEFSGDQVRARHILLQTEEEAKQVLQRLGKNESFEDLARGLSRDSATAPKGGDLDYIRREQVVPEFGRAAFALKPGEVSGVVKTPFGYHIIKVVDRRKGQAFTFEQVKEQLRRRLLDERQGQRYQEWVKGMESAAKISRDESLLPVGRPTPPPAPSSGVPGEGQSGGKL
jgi:EpsD family peptidyl-prolyl cis-trans isomerase